MPIGDNGKEQFADAIVRIRNRSIILFIDTLMVLRGEVISNDELQVRSGIDTVTQRHFAEHLLNCDRMRRRITYNPEDAIMGILAFDKADPNRLVEETIDPKKVIDEGAKPFSTDDVQAGSGPLWDVPYALDGSDVNIPLFSKLNMRSPLYRQLLQAIDMTVVAATRLESRMSTRHIGVRDSQRLYGNLKAIWEGLMAFGGDANRVDIAAGVRPSEEPRGPTNAPNMITETAVPRPAA